MPILSPELVEITARHQVYLERLKAGNRKEFEKVVRAMDRAIRDIMGQLPDTPTQAQADAAIARIGQAIAIVLDGYIAQHIAELGELAIYEAGFQARAIGEVIEGRAVAIVAPSNTVINRALDSSPMSVRDARAGLTVLEVARQFSANQVARIENRIRLGYFEGKTTTQLVKEIRGLASLRFQDGELAQVAKSAQIMAADTFQFASSIGKQATLEANDITEYEWVSVLDSRTSAQCRSLDGRRFTVGKGPLPPIHPNCRSSVVPVLPNGFDLITAAATRNAEGGAVDADLTYYDWLKTQPTAFVEDVLGKDRAKLLLEGGISAEKFSALQLNRNFQPLTLEEMKKKEPLAFERAGL
jgi:SPP1 gp7 family putative phage head morphogenesis protein